MVVTKRTSVRVLAIGAWVLAVGCTDGMNPPSPQSRTRSNVISDQLHNGGTAGFFFLPPMVPRPAVLGDNVWGVRPVIRIDEIRADGTTVRTLASFTATSGPGGERIRTHEHGRPCDHDDDDRDDDDDDYYYARWNTHDAHLSVTARYRARVFVPQAGGGQRELGFADVDVVRTEREFRSVDTENFTPLVNGRMLRVKFRLERVAVDRDRDGVFDWVDNCINVPNRDQRDSNRDGQGDVCECAAPTCAPTDACHVAGACNTRDGSCTTPEASNGTACPLPNATAACTHGVCGVTACAAGFDNCDGSAANGCETPTTTLSNCGGCGRTCEVGSHASPTCATGSCALTCTAGFANVNGRLDDGCEVDLSNDTDHCGRVNNACGSRPGASAACVAGACVFTCNAGLADCNTNPADGCERPTASDESNCGGCGVTCSGGRACVGGACSAVACVSGRADCDGNAANGCEVTLATDAAHCGVCTTACSFAHAAATCAVGSCVMGSCATGYANVDRDASNGCEVNLATDPAHCGAENNACPARANATATCSNGACGFTCAAGYADVDRSAANGCEVDLSTDVRHCGTENNACPARANATVTCAAGVCGFTCDATHADVDRSAANGCEVDLSTDVNHCGRVGRACDVRSGTATTCVAGECAYACNANLGDCDGDTANGCESRLNGDDVNHCGGCEVVCTAGPHAAPTCASGTCGIACESGYTDCNGNPADGCEVQLAGDVNHCGACNTVCPVRPGASAAVCTGGVCGVQCAAGRGDCDGNAANGCEVDLSATDNCGACGTVCSYANASATCNATVAGRSCGFGVCDDNYGDCDSAQANGCETRLDTVTHCGGCNIACAAPNGTAACVNHACAVTACDAGYTLSGGACVDVDECATAGRCDAGFACVNTPGSFRCDNIDECAPNPCQNGGLCNDQVNGYTCTCAGFYTGARCETPPPCASNPCLNGGACTNTATGYTCACSGGYAGANCGIQTCATNPCQNGGTCANTATGYACTCAGFYTGTNCEVAPSCASNPCLNGGACTNTATGYTCTCAGFYTGTRCEIPPACASNPCQNGGACTNTATGYTCACTGFYTGARCETPPPCASNPCQNGGTCTNSATGYTCTCSGGYAGANCEVQTCASNPCQNGGTCTNTATGYACTCDIYHTGTRCETLRTCASNPCLNGGACGDATFGFTCGCPSGYAGPTCATVLTCAPPRSVATVGACGRSDSKCIFLTSCAYAGGDIGGLEGGDAICQAHAQAAGLRGTYRAWLSTASVSAASRLAHSTVPYVDVFGFQISANWTDLTNDTTIGGPGNVALLNRQQNGSLSNATVWTGTNASGLGYLLSTSNCDGWFSNTSSGVNGNSGLSDAQEWTNDGYSATCTELSRLYCFEQ